MGRRKGILVRVFITDFAAAKKPNRSPAKRVRFGKEETWSTDGKTATAKAIAVFLPCGMISDVVRVEGFEPPASWSQTKRATSCATPGNTYLRCGAFPRRAYYTASLERLQAVSFRGTGAAFSPSHARLLPSPFSSRTGCVIMVSFVFDTQAGSSGPQPSRRKERVPC